MTKTVPSHIQLNLYKWNRLTELCFKVSKSNFLHFRVNFSAMQDIQRSTFESQKKRSEFRKRLNLKRSMFFAYNSSRLQIKSPGLSDECKDLMEMSNAAWRGESNSASFLELEHVHGITLSMQQATEVLFSCKKPSPNHPQLIKTLRSHT